MKTKSLSSKIISLAVVLALLLSLFSGISITPKAVFADENVVDNAGAAANSTTADSTDDIIYVEAGKPFSVELAGNGTQDVVISGYADEDDWYVTDGLVLMYDGIYNQSMNESSTTATTWEELTGNGSAMTISPASDENATDGQWWIVGDDGNAAGLTVKDVGVDEVMFNSSIYVNDGFTLDFGMSLEDRSVFTTNTQWNYLYQLTTTGWNSLTRINSENLMMCYHSSGYNWAASTAYTSDAIAFSQITLLSDNVAKETGDTRLVYVDGKQISEKSFPDFYVDENSNSFDGVSIPTFSVLASNSTLDNDSNLSKNLYSLRLYNRALIDEEVSQNNAIEKSRFVDGSYIEIGEVTYGSNTITLTEFDFEEKEISTTVSDVNFSTGTAELSLVLNREYTLDSEGGTALYEGEYTLYFEVGENTIEQKVVLLSSEEAEEVTAVKELIDVINSADGINTNDLNDIVNASQAYSFLNSDQKGFLGTTYILTLETAIAELDKSLLEAEYTFELTYFLNDSVGDPAYITNTSVNVYYKGEIKTLEIPTEREMYTFEGWYYGDTQITGADGEMLDQWTLLFDAEITAHWTKTSGLGTEETPYEIDSAEKWYALADILATENKPKNDDISDELKDAYSYFAFDSGYVAGYSELQTAYYELTSDIILQPIDGYIGVPNFAGTFDGGSENGYTITLDYDEFDYTSTGDTYFGGIFSTVFGTEEAPATIKNVTIEGEISGTYTVDPEETDDYTAYLQSIGVLASYTSEYVDIENVINNVDITLAMDMNSTAYAYVGAIVASGSGTDVNIVDCINYGDFEITIENASNYYLRVGGLAGYANSTVSFDSCENYGDITHKGVGYSYIGGLVGSGSSIIYTNCIQASNLSSVGDSSYVGAFGSMSSASSENYLQLTVEGTEGDIIVYEGSSIIKAVIDLTGIGTIQIPADENTSFDMDSYLYVQGNEEERIYYYNIISTSFTSDLKTSDALVWDMPFQSEDDSITLSTEEDVIALQSAINYGTEADIDAIFELAGTSVANEFSQIKESERYIYARFSLQTANYVLGDSIVITDSTFTGIGTSAYAFGGTFDGDGKTITYAITDSSPQYIGLFGYIYPVFGTSPEIKDIDIIANIDLYYDAAPSVTTYIGGVVGYASSCSIENVDVVANVNLDCDTAISATMYVGGLAGYIYGCNITDITMDCDVEASISARLGGLVGGANYCTIENVAIVSNIDLDYVVETGAITYVGGVVGWLSNSTTENVMVKVESISVNFDPNITTAGSAFYVGGVSGYGAVSDIDVEISGNIIVSTTSISYVSAVTHYGVVSDVTVTFTGDVEKVEASSSNSDVSNTTSVAILTGYVYSNNLIYRNVEIINETNNVIAVESNTYAGGLVGQASGSAATVDGVTIDVDESVVISGDFKISGKYAGGVVGHANTDYNILVDGYSNAMEIDASVYGAGFIGVYYPNSVDRYVTIVNSIDASGGSYAFIGYARVGYTDNISIINSAYVESTGETKAVNNLSIVTDVIDTSAIVDSAYGAEIIFVTPADEIISSQLSVAEDSAFAINKDGKLVFTNAGDDQTITLLWGGAEIYQTTVNVAKATVAVPTAGDTVYTYNGTEQTYVATDSEAGAANFGSAGLYALSNANRTNAGEQTVTAVLLDEDNYAWATGENPTFTFTIAKATPTVVISSVVPNDDDTDVTITAQVVGMNGEFPAGTMSFYASDLLGTATVDARGIASYETTVDGGASYNFYAIFTPEAEANYVEATASTVNFDAAKINETVSITNSSVVTYGDEQFTIALSEYLSEGNVTYSSSDSNVISVEGSTVTIVSAGTATITATIAGDETYNQATAMLEITVAKADYIMTGVEWNYSSEFIYNGEEKFVELSALPQGVVSADSVTAVYANNTATKAGEYTARVTFEYDSANYNAPTAIADLTWTIAKADPAYTATATATYGDTLADIVIEDGFTFEDDTIPVGDVGNKTFKATFTPSDTANYNVIENIDVTVTVAQKSILSGNSVTGVESYYIAQGLAEQSSVTFSVDGVELVLGTDYTISYSETSESGTVTFTGIGNYTGSGSMSYSIIEEVTNTQLEITGQMSTTFAELVSDIINSLEGESADETNAEKQELLEAFAGGVAAAVAGGDGTVTISGANIVAEPEDGDVVTVYVNDSITSSAQSSILADLENTEYNATDSVYYIKVATTDEILSDTSATIKVPYEWQDDVVYKIAHLKSDGSVEYLNADKITYGNNDTKYLEFEVTSFSAFMVVSQDVVETSSSSSSSSKLSAEAITKITGTSSSDDTEEEVETETKVEVETPTATVAPTATETPVATATPAVDTDPQTNGGYAVWIILGILALGVIGFVIYKKKK